jgi:hypothetical protein
MLFKKPKKDSQKCPNGHPCDNKGKCRKKDCEYRDKTKDSY